MINSETNWNGGANVIPANEKQPPAAIKKMALRDVQNQKGSFLGSHQENLVYAGARSNADAIKVCGTKRLTPERPLSSPSHLSLGNNAVNEHIVNARRRFELELGRGRMYNNMDRFADCSQSRQLQHEIPQRHTHLRESSNSRTPVATSSNTTSPPPFSYSGPSVPNCVGKYGNNIQSAGSLTVSSGLHHSVIAKTTSEQQRTKRFIRLQKFLKQCDESYQSEYIHMLLHLSPAELSRHAVELEKRAIQLAIEEGKEIQRMKALDILAKSAPANNPLQTPQLYQSRN